MAALIPSTKDNVDEPPAVSQTVGDCITKEPGKPVSLESSAHRISPRLPFITALIPLIPRILIAPTPIQHLPCNRIHITRRPISRRRNSTFQPPHSRQSRRTHSPNVNIQPLFPRSRRTSIRWLKSRYPSYVRINHLTSPFLLQFLTRQLFFQKPYPFM